MCYYSWNRGIYPLYSNNPNWRCVNESFFWTFPVYSPHTTLNYTTSKWITKDTNEPFITMRMFQIDSRWLLCSIEGSYGYFHDFPLHGIVLFSPAFFELTLMLEFSSGMRNYMLVQVQLFCNINITLNLTVSHFLIRIPISENGSDWRPPISLMSQGFEAYMICWEG
jgi:hypothetical protein